MIGPECEDEVRGFLESRPPSNVCQLAKEACRKLTSGDLGVVLPEGAAREMCKIDLLVDGEIFWLIETALLPQDR
jgi:hypothetical protein